MAEFARLGRWIAETDGEKLFMTAYQLANEAIPEPLAQTGWVVSAPGLSELSRLGAAMEITQRCLNASYDLYRLNEQASQESMILRLRMLVGLVDRSETLTLLAQLSRLAALSRLSQAVPHGRKKELHDANPNCCWCGISTLRGKSAAREVKASIEHLWPKYLGGSSSTENLSIACEPCNNLRQHAFSWAWFPTSAMNEVLNKDGKVPREAALAIALHRLIKVASGQTGYSAQKTTLKHAVQLLGQDGAIPKIQLDANNRYTFFEMLKISME